MAKKFVKLLKHHEYAFSPGEVRLASVAARWHEREGVRLRAMGACLMLAPGRMGLAAQAGVQAAKSKPPHLPD